MIVINRDGLSSWEGFNNHSSGGKIGFCVHLYVQREMKA